MAVLYDDPDSIEDGVIDLSSVIATSTTSREDVDKFNVRNLENDATLFDAWIDKGWLSRVVEPAMYLYRIGWRDINDEPQQGSGVFAVNNLGPAGLATNPDIVPVNAPGFSDLLVPAGMPIARATDANGNHHRLWPLTQRGVQQTIAEAIEEYGTPANITPQSRLVLAYESSETIPEVAIGLVMVK